MMAGQDDHRRNHGTLYEMDVPLTCPFFLQCLLIPFQMLHFPRHSFPIPLPGLNHEGVNEELDLDLQKTSIFILIG